MNTMTKIALSTVISMALGTAAIAADSGTAGQAVSITVPVVKLLDVKSTNGTSTAGDDGAGATIMTLVAPATAGDNFASVDATGYFDITSNAPFGSSATQKITVSADAIAPGWKLGVSTTATGVGTAPAPAAAPSFTSTTTAGQTLVSGIGNVAKADNVLTYTFGPEDAEIAPSSTAGHNVTLTFTLENDA